MSPSRLVVYFLAALMTFLLTGLVRRHALAKNVLDHPNERSSHTRPTPRGGGLAIVLVFTAALALMAGRLLPIRMAVTLAGGGLLVAGIGYLDDIRNLSARCRLLVHIAASTLIVIAVITSPHANPASALMGITTGIAAALFLTWTINLYNFMDGIDGIASIEAITVAVGASACLWSSGSPTWQAPLALAACVAGFLVWNFPPAKIFMGDSGSGYLGIILGGWAVWTAHDNPNMLWCWLILLGAFIADSTLTLVRRSLLGEHPFAAHRSHAYQHAAALHGSHKQVAMAFGIINMLWLLPLAVMTALRRLDGIAAMLLAYAPLFVLAYRYRAGLRD